MSGESDLFFAVHGDGQPLLLLHGGMGLDHTYFRPWLDPLGDAAQLIFVDHRGNGRSAAPENWSAVDHATWIADVDALRERLGHEKVVLLGHSYGGFLALEYALRYPDRLSGLILCSTAPAVDYPEVMAANAAARGTPEQVGALQRALTNRAPDDRTAGQWWREIFPLYFHHPNTALLGTVADRIRFRSDAWNRSNFDLLPTFNVADRLHEIQAPTLVLTGGDDWIMPLPHAAERLHAALPHSELIVFPRSGHFPWMEEPDAFVAAVRQWLERHPAG